MNSQTSQSGPDNHVHLVQCCLNLPSSLIGYSFQTQQVGFSKKQFSIFPKFGAAEWNGSWHVKWRLQADTILMCVFNIWLSEMKCPGGNMYIIFWHQLFLLFLKLQTNVTQTVSSRNVKLVAFYPLRAVFRPVCVHLTCPHTSFRLTHSLTPSAVCQWSSGPLTGPRPAQSVFPAPPLHLFPSVFSNRPFSQQSQARRWEDGEERDEVVRLHKLEVVISYRQQREGRKLNLLKDDSSRNWAQTFMFQPRSKMWWFGVWWNSWAKCNRVW